MRKAFLWGLVVAIVINLYMPFSEYILHSSRLTFGYIPMGVLVPFVTFVFIVNPLLKTLKREWALNSSQMVIVLIMAMTASIFPTLGLLGFMLSLLATPYYFASNENGWAEYIHPYIRQWAVPTGDVRAMKWFFDGIPKGEHIPWDVWMAPMFWWVILIGALLTISICAMNVFRKQWVERERLTFPLAQMSIAMVQGQDGANIFPLQFKSKAFVAGFLVPVVCIGWNIINYFVPGFPRITLMDSKWIHVARNFPTIHVKTNFFVLSFAFLTNLDVLFSIWFFHLLTILQIGIQNRMGFTLGSSDLWCASDPATSWQAFGGFIFFVLWGIWVARDHLKEVWKIAWRTGEKTNAQDLLGYRSSLIGLLLATLFLVYWFRSMGMEYKIIAAYMFAAFVINFGITKLVSQCGLIYVRPSLTAQSFALRTIGSANLTPDSMTGMMFTFAYCSDNKYMMFYTSAHAGKMTEVMRLNPRSLVVGMAFATVISIVASFIITLKIGYAHGAYNFGAWEYQSGNIQIVETIVSKMRNPTPTDWPQLGFLGIGFSVMAILTWLNLHFVRWPLNPIGFIFGFSWALRAATFSIFLAWLIKVIVLKVGGIGLYRKTIPFFVGTLIGYVFGVTISFLVDWIWFYGEGHTVHHW